MHPQHSQREFLDPGVLARLSRLELQSRWPMEGNIAGRHKSPHRGASVEFAEYRKYVPGDDPRFLDWRVYARRDRFYLKEFEADTNLRCYLVLDASGSMAYANKFLLARKLAATLGYLAMQQGDAVGLMCCGAKLTTDIAPRRKPAHLKNIFDAMAAAKPEGETGLVSALHTVAEKIRRRALVAVFSDLFHDPEELLHCFRHLRFRKHDLAVFHLLDRTEVDFKFDRPIRFVDMEDQSTIVAEPGVIYPRYREALDTYLDKLKRGCTEFKVDYRLVMADEDYEKVLADFLLARMRT
ncbi:MAG: DUF58 domain-containing protein [Verrucomicrobia bacterium]|nr:DUF58 domain-containing protein [Verrucomicrobiota bacterium]